MEESDTCFSFTGTIQGFRQTGSWKKQTRTVVKTKNKAEWVITDTVNDNGGLPVSQIWNPNTGFHAAFAISAIDGNGHLLEPVSRKGYYSTTYGLREDAEQIVFQTNTLQITTTIRLK